MTPARKKALQWYDDNPSSALRGFHCPDKPTPAMALKMMKDGELRPDSEHFAALPPGLDIAIHYKCSLTDLGRRRLNGDDV